MNVHYLRRYFVGLALLATVLLWGVSVWNGTVTALVLAVYHGQMAEGLPLQTRYTGIPLVDIPIALLVAFFFHGTKGHHMGYQTFLLDAYSTLQSAFVWLYVESRRAGAKPKWISYPVIFGLSWQAFGAAISLPLYYAVHIGWVLGDQATGTVGVVDAAALPASFLLGAIVPAITGMFPTWVGPKGRTAIQHQWVLAAWQPDPVWVSWIQLLLAAVIRRVWRSPHGPHDSHRWIRRSYLLAATCSAVGHVYVILKALWATDLSLWAMYVPNGFSGSPGTDDILVRGPWLFLQYDLIIIALSSLSWAFALLCHAFEGERRFSPGKAGLLMAVGALTIGPGGTVSLALLARQNQMHRIQSKRP